MNKNILIIEDNYEHLQIIRTLLSGSDINTFPSLNDVDDDQKLAEFLTPINHMLAADDENIRNENKEKFLDSINKTNLVDLFIVDFQLFADKNTCNGIKFCEYINDIKNGNTPVILLTKYKDYDKVIKKTSITALKSNLILKYPKIKIEIVNKFMNDGRVWDKGEMDEKGKLKTDIIAMKSSETKNTITNYIKLFCDKVQQNSSIKQPNKSSE